MFILPLCALNPQINNFSTVLFPVLFATVLQMVFIDFYRHFTIVMW